MQWTQILASLTVYASSINQIVTNTVAHAVFGPDVAALRANCAARRDAMLLIRSA